ncbi:ABC transporter ATP-binding protein [Dyella amyloliquefaciens]|uniref:ABC transporter ATP-binding protein n=1 Tax=Dyella amyloliquefaciens TaxID=1770545 RepID=UPI00102EC610|nr:ABC transporter ATP-binding protein [Dyella amyloliquefaciens]
MSSELMVTAEDLGKCYQIYAKPADRLKQMLYPRAARLVGRQMSPLYGEFWALRGVNFEVMRGETVGVLGRNGSGKSTLLQLLCGTVPHTEGQWSVRGRVAALLELGAGFKPEFTGRENVLISSAIAGLSEEEAEARMDKVIEFSELGDVIDRPVKTYSSGMYVRLAFAAAIHVNPDLLVVDEALAVGDARFQAKCFRRINEMKDQGVTIMFVTHATEQVAMHCSRALLLDGGRLLDDGHPRQVTNRYLDLLFGRSSTVRNRAEESMAKASDLARRAAHEVGDDSLLGPVSPKAESFVAGTDSQGFKNRLTYNQSEYRWGDGRAEILDYLLVGNDSADPAMLVADEEAELYVRALFHTDIETPVFGFSIKTINGLMLTGCNSRDAGEGWGTRYRSVRAGETVIYRFRFRPRFESSNYLLSLGIAVDNGGELTPVDRRYDSILVNVESREPFYGLVGIGASCEFLTSEQ